MTSLTPMGLCRNYFLALDKLKSGETISELEFHCTHNCNGRYNPSVNNCNPATVRLEEIKILQKKYPGSYLI